MPTMAAAATVKPYRRSGCGGAGGPAGPGRSDRGSRRRRAGGRTARGRGPRPAPSPWRSGRAGRGPGISPGSSGGPGGSSRRPVRGAGSGMDCRSLARLAAKFLRVFGPGTGDLGGLAGQGLEEHQAQRVEVGPVAVGGLRSGPDTTPGDRREPLGGHVGQRPAEVGRRHFVIDVVRPVVGRQVEVEAAAARPRPSSGRWTASGRRAPPPGRRHGRGPRRAWRRSRPAPGDTTGRRGSRGRA